MPIQARQSEFGKHHQIGTGRPRPRRQNAVAIADDVADRRVDLRQGDPE